MNNFRELKQIKHDFEPHIENKDIIYTYIAPKDQKLYNKFYQIASNFPTVSGSMAEVLSEDSTVKKILTENFQSDIELEIYFATDDSLSAIAIKGTLRDYIERENINFNY